MALATVLRVAIAVAAWAAPASAQFRPGNLLRGQVPAVMREFPQEIRLPQGLLDRINTPNDVQEHHHPLASLLRGALMCCRAMTAECLACVTNQDAVQFCSEMRHVGVQGCEEVLHKAMQDRRNQALDGVLNEVVEGAAKVVGGGDATAQVKDYLERNPSVARKNLANLTNEAFDTMSSLKHSLFQPEPTDAPETEVHATGNVPLRLVDEALEGHKSGVAGVSLPDLGPIGAALSSFGNPWLIAGVALLVTAISTGVAFGALCHARLHSTAREPLLSNLLTEVEVGRRGTGGTVAD